MMLIKFFYYTSVGWDKNFGAFVKDVMMPKHFFLFEYWQFLSSKKIYLVLSLGNSD